MKKKYILWSAFGVGVITITLSLLLKKKPAIPNGGGTYGKYYNKLNDPDYRAFIADFANNRELVSEYAQQLHNAMKEEGTNFNKILEIMSNLDETQMKIVSDRFGKRAYYNRLFGKIKTSNGKMLTLKEWFKEELDKSEYQQVKDRYPNLF